MGRTNPTYRDLLSDLESRWKSYRRGLRRDDQERFDRLFEQARGHADAAGNRNHPEPFYPLALSILLAHERRLEGVEEQLETIDERLEVIEDRLETAETLPTSPEPTPNPSESDR